MRKYNSVIIILIMMICTFSFIDVFGSSKPLIGKTIYIDPGHGGIDSGATYKDILEKDINLSISFVLASKLELAGATVYLTRYNDNDLSSIGVKYRKKSDLSNRAKIINDSKADMYISIHLNSTTSETWKGLQVFYDDINEENEKIASYITESTKTKRKKSEITTMYMNKRINVPGVLIEVGFLSNYSDRKQLLSSTYQEQISDDIITGIINYFNSTN